MSFRSGPPCQCRDRPDHDAARDNAFSPWRIGSGMTDAAAPTVPQDGTAVRNPRTVETACRDTYLREP
jgi:hypothetical protein